MASLLSLPLPRTTIAIGFSDPSRLPSVSIRGVPVHSNLNRAIVYEISKHEQLQYWADLKLTHMVEWEEIDLAPFERAQERTTVHMSYFITKFISNTLAIMKILQQQEHASTILFRCCVCPRKRYIICINTFTRAVA